MRRCAAREPRLWTCSGVGTDEQAERLGISIVAAERAQSRAFERLRKLFEIARRTSARGELADPE